jgi:hypothetical protein
MMRTTTATWYIYFKAYVTAHVFALQADFDAQSVLTSYTDGLCELSKLPNTSNAEVQALSVKECSKLLHSIITSVGTAICSSLAKATHVQVREHVLYYM